MIGDQARTQLQETGAVQIPKHATVAEIMWMLGELGIPANTVTIETSVTIVYHEHVIDIDLDDVVELLDAK